MDHNTPIQLRYFELHLHRLRLAKASSESEIVFVSMDHVCASDGLNSEVCIHGEKVFKWGFRRWLRWGVESETIKYMLETKICVVTDQRFLRREKMESRINKFYPKLISILADDDEDDDDVDEDDDDNDEDDDVVEKDVKQVMEGSNDSDCAKKRGKMAEMER